MGGSLDGEKPFTEMNAKWSEDGGHVVARDSLMASKKGIGAHSPSLSAY